MTGYRPPRIVLDILGLVAAVGVGLLIGWALAEWVLA